jgi:hypothetical protein
MVGVGTVRDLAAGIVMVAGVLDDFVGAMCARVAGVGTGTFFVAVNSTARAWPPQS